MKKYLLAILVCFILQNSLTAQSTVKDQPNYKTGFGLRFSPFGVSLKFNNGILGKTSFELIGYFKDGFTTSALYYWNITLNQPGNIKLYVGGGGQVGFKNSNSGGGAVFGAGGVVGADYKFLHQPINISLDWQPSVQFGKGNNFTGFGGIAVRLTI